MSYRRLFDLKYKKGMSTYELVCRFPKEIKQVSEVALLDIPEATLKEVIREKKLFERLIELKKKFSKDAA